MNKEIEELARKSLIEYSKARMCLVASIGTGNLVSNNGKKYIFTCKHVADEFFKMKTPVVTLLSNKKIETDNLNYIGSSDEFDIAVIQINDDTITDMFYEPKDFQSIEDFTDYNFEDADLHLCGFPFSFRYETESERERFWFSYLTVPIKNKTEKDFVYCDYPLGKDLEIFNSSYTSKLPDPKGLSGSFVHLIDGPAIKENEIWSLKFVKVIAMQISWNTKNHLKCVSIKHIKNILNDLPI
jgi:hypothetical protein